MSGMPFVSDSSPFEHHSVHNEISNRSSSKRMRPGRAENVTCLSFRGEGNNMGRASTQRVSSQARLNCWDTYSRLTVEGLYLELDDEPYFYEILEPVSNTVDARNGTQL